MIKPQYVDFYNEQGYLLVKGVLNPQEVAEMRTAVGASLDRAANEPRPQRAVAGRLPPAGRS